jgi:hypothetical protein
MRRLLIHLLVSASTLAVPAAARGADDLTPLNQPTLPMPAPLPAPPVSYLRPNRLDVWQNYGVDRHGRWVPRVILINEGAFYYYNGRPYPIISVQQLNWMPYMLD